MMRGTLSYGADADAPVPELWTAIGAQLVSEERAPVGLQRACGCRLESMDGRFLDLLGDLDRDGVCLAQPVPFELGQSMFASITLGHTSGAVLALGKLEAVRRSGGQVSGYLRFERVLRGRWELEGFLRPLGPPAVGDATALPAERVADSVAVVAPAPPLRDAGGVPAPPVD